MRGTPVVAALSGAIAILVTIVIVGDTSGDGSPPAAPEAVPTATPIGAPGASNTPTPAETTTATPSATVTPEPSPEPTADASPERTEAARYRDAISARDGGDLDTAVAELSVIAEGRGVLAPSARFRLAQALATAGDDEAAVEAFERALADPARPSTLRPLGRREGAASLAALHRLDEAIEWLDAVVSDRAASSSDQTFAQWERAQLLRAIEDPVWGDVAVAIVVQSPGHPVASMALDELEAAELPVPALPAAYTRYLARQNDVATARYEAILDDVDTPPDAATAGVAWFYLGALAERVPDRGAAIEAYGQSLAVDPTGSRADDAAYWRRRVAEEDGDFVTAAAAFDLLVTAYPGSRFVSDGATRGALALLSSGDEAGALDRLAAIALGAGAADASGRAAAARWYELIAGPEARLAAGVPAASEIDSRSLGAILERAGATALDTPLVEPFALPDAGLDAIGSWLTSQYGAAPATNGLDAELFELIAPALLDAGERALARALVLQELNAIESAHAQIELSQHASGLGLDDVALIATIRLLSPLPTETRLETPLDLERLAYPAPWHELVIAASEEFEVPPLLLLALARQESAFEPDVISPAGAVGLTQVIPPTGVQIAAVLDESWTRPASLTEPETSLRYGAAYLSAQLEAFDGNVFAALAAYNAGPSNARRWLDAQLLPGADGYVQTIDFEGTRRYVTTVIEQYAWYRYLYEVAELPSIR